MLVVLILAAAALYVAGGAALAGPMRGHGSTSGGGVGECWFVKDAAGVHVQVGDWYYGMPALCTLERH